MINRQELAQAQRRVVCAVESIPIDSLPFAFVPVPLVTDLPPLPLVDGLTVRTVGYLAPAVPASSGSPARS